MSKVLKIKKTCKIIILLISIYIFQSCAIAAISSEPITFNKDSENGLIVGTISFSNNKARFNTYLPYFHSLDKVNFKKLSTEIFIRPSVWNGKHIGELEDGKTYLFAFERKPGKYRLAHIRLSTVSSVGGYTRDSYINFNEDVSKTFEVKKGEITYFGELFIDELTTPKITIVKFNNKLDRDLEGLKMKQPNIDWELLKK